MRGWFISGLAVALVAAAPSQAFAHHNWFHSFLSWWWSTNGGGGGGIGAPGPVAGVGLPFLVVGAAWYYFRRRKPPGADE
jgi:hypothetical protein